jgi:predicted DNA-binding ribbon-helix-helix protein
MSKSLYDRDYYLWIEDVLKKIQEKKWEEMDWDNLWEEIDDMGKSQKQRITSNLRILLMHLLKWEFQPEKRTNSWKYTIIEHRRRILEQLEDSPSLKNYLNSNLESTYQKARKDASLETNLSLNTFPNNYPYTLDLVLDEDWFLE